MRRILAIASILALLALLMMYLRVDRSGLSDGLVAVELPEELLRTVRVLSPGAPRDTVLQVGRLEGREVEVFGDIEDVELGAGGDIYVLDRLAHDIRRFDGRGAFVGRAGREGRGPGEFVGPTAVALDTGSASVLVADARLYRITVFGTQGEALTHQRDVRFPFDRFVQDLCVVGGRIVLHAVTDSALLHDWSPGEGIVRSFAAPVDQVDDPALWANERLRPALRGFQNRGLLACAGDKMVLAHRTMPFVRAFEVEGDSIWTTVLGEFRRQTQIPGPAGRGITYAPDPATGRLRASGESLSWRVASWPYRSTREASPTPWEASRSGCCRRRTDASSPGCRRSSSCWVYVTAWSTAWPTIRTR